ncbi:hypothetical protein ACROYT_G033067 [Oculina patagonica]
MYLHNSCISTGKREAQNDEEATNQQSLSRKEGLKLARKEEQLEAWLFLQGSWMLRRFSFSDKNQARNIIIQEQDKFNLR